MKQPQIPVVFLTECKTRKYPLAIDIRNQSACDAVAFSKSQNFAVSATVNVGGSGGEGMGKGRQMDLQDHFGSGNHSH